MLAASVLLGACSRPAPSAEPVRAVRSMMIATGPSQGQQEYAAEVRARTETRLAFRVGGKLVQRQAELGQAVRTGQVLAQLDPVDLRLGQDAARAAVEAARVSADQARADWQRFKDLHAQGFISAAELQRRESTRLAAESQLAQAQAQAGVQGNQASYSRLLAPADGVVTAVDAEPGAVLGAGAPVLRLALAGPRDVVFAVPEDRVEHFRALARREGQVQVRRWGRSEAMPAAVREVAAAADPVTRTFLVKADLGKASVDLGQTMTVVVDLPILSGVVRLPLAAVLEQQGRSVVWLLDAASMTVHAQPVQIAGADGNQIVIASGLAAGAEVVTAGVHVLSEGQKVTRYVDPAVAAR